ncbi:hypothetical protein VKT23_008237 [Stygiomarasmius scandens]|uniref:Prokaryotic-type class I peptide chain release factors domain-containing protein n=1 Tax=Marasmiellus scandens TaxID=2682957 RepID=A0ABR1JHN2_9AGAR
MLPTRRVLAFLPRTLHQHVQNFGFTNHNLTFRLFKFNEPSRPNPRLFSTTIPIPDLPVPPSFPTLSTPEQHLAARSWAEKFKTRRIPKKLVEFTFSRSSGPGGQNVNKVNTKATLRCSLEVEWIPGWGREGLKGCPHYVSSTKSIQISSTQYRSQAQNVEDCLDKLHALILTTSIAPIRNPTSEETKKRVEGFERAVKERNRKEKARRSDVKKTRGKASAKGGAWD